MIELIILLVISLLLVLTFLIDRTAIILLLLFIVWYIPRQTAPGAYLENYTLLRWIMLLLLPLLIFLFLLVISFKKFKIDFCKIEVWLLLFVCYSMVSGLLNEVKLVDWFGYLGLYITYPILFIILANLNIKEKKLKIFLSAFITLLLLQIPECFYRYFVLGVTGDHLSWTLGPWGTTDLGVYMIYALFILISFWITGVMKKLWQKLLVILLILIFFILSVLGEMKAFLISSLLISLIIFSKAKKFSLLAFIIITFILMSYTIWASIYSPEQNYLYLFILNLTNLLKMGDLEFLLYSSGTARISAGLIVLNNIYQEPLHFWFGYGPGSSFAGSFTGEEGLLLKLGWFLKQYTNQFSAMLVDVGIIGLILYFILLINLFKLIKIAIISARGKFIRAIGYASFGMWFFYSVLSPWYILSWRLDSASFIFYVFLSFLYSNTKGRSNEINSGKL